VAYRNSLATLHDILLGSVRSPSTQAWHQRRTFALVLRARVWQQATHHLQGRGGDASGQHRG
jgi:hypothetical protein